MIICIIALLLVAIPPDSISQKSAMHGMAHALTQWILRRKLAAMTHWQVGRCLVQLVTARERLSTRAGCVRR